METQIVEGFAGASHVKGAPLTTTITREVSEELLRNEIDERIVKIRPMSTPIDQISRLADARLSSSMIVDYYSVDTPPSVCKLFEGVESSQTSDIAELSVDNIAMFSPSDTILLPGVKGKAPGSCLMLYVISTGDKLRVKAINPPTENTFPALNFEQSMIRMGRAAAELDVQTSQSEALPIKRRNFCQIFKCQVEQSILQRLSAKEVGWSLTDQEETALIDMRLSMEKNFLFGARTRFEKDNTHGEVFTTEGIWTQAGKEFSYVKDKFNEEELVRLSRAAFTGNAGSSRKVLIGGSGFIEQLSMLPHVKTAGPAETVTRWGIDFTEITTKFGRLYVVLSEVFDACGHADEAMVLDPEYIQKYSHIPFKAMPIDLRSSGQRNCEVIVLTEASCIVLRYPDAHLRIVTK